MNEPDINIDHQQDGEIRRYWLGQLSPDEAAHLEERYFAADNLFARVRVVKEELIDDYLFNRLNAEDRLSFDTHFLKPAEHREHLETIQALIEKLRVAPQPGPSPAMAQYRRPEAGQTTFGKFWGDLSAGFKVLAWIGAALIFFAVIGTVTLYRENRQIRHELAQLRADQQRREEEYQKTIAALQTREIGRPIPSPSPSVTPSQQTAATPKILPSPESASATVFASLLSNLTRAGQEIEPVTIPPVAQRLSLRLLLDKPAAYRSYQAQLKDEGGQVRQSKRGLRSSAHNAVEIEFPASLFRAERYSVVLYGVDGKKEPSITGDYSFRIVKE